MGNDGPICIRHSRALLLAAGASGTVEGELYQRITQSSVAVSVDPDCPGASATALTLVDTLRRLPATLSLERTGLPAHLVHELVAAAEAVDRDRELQVRPSPAGAIRIHVGPHNPGAAIRVVPEGHGAHLLLDSTATVRPTRSPSGLGCVLAASFAAGRTFVELAAVTPTRFRTRPHTAFCPVTLSGDLSAAPDVPPDAVADLGILGAGAVGTAVGRILSLCELQGHLLIADRQSFATENLGTYSLGTAADADAATAKTRILRRSLPSWDVSCFDSDIADLPAQIDSGNYRWPHTVITALDTVQARRDAQRLWPDHLIDAGTSDTVAGIHDLSPDGPCMNCIYPIDTAGPSAEARLAERTGLDAAYLAEGQEPLDAAVLEGLTREVRETLRPLVGQPRCGIAHAIGLSSLDAAGYQPAIPFVAQQAACLAIGRTFARVSGLTSPALVVQYDTLLGPHLLHTDGRRPQADCYCQGAAGRVRSVRQERARRAGVQSR